MSLNITEMQLGVSPISRDGERIAFSKSKKQGGAYHSNYYKKYVKKDFGIDICQQNLKPVKYE